MRSLLPVRAAHHADVALGAILCCLLVSPPARGGDTVQRDFNEANALKEGDACKEAIDRYSEVLAVAPPTDRVNALALYNQAVCFETLGKLAPAKANYDALLERRDPEARMLRHDVRFRRGLVLIADNQPAAARRDLHAVRRATPDPRSRARVDVQLAWIDVGAGRLRRASRLLQRSITMLRNPSNEAGPDSYFLAQALCGLGDVFLAEAARVTVHRRNAQRTVYALKKRAEFLERAQGYYVAAIDQHVPTWAAAATLHLGRGFQAAADDLWRFSRPPDQLERGDATQQAAIQAWIQNNIPALLRKSFEAYSICQSLGFETGDVSRFTQACSEALDSFPTDRLVSGQDS